jgi:hypothetical protein
MLPITASTPCTACTASVRGQHTCFSHPVIESHPNSSGFRPFPAPAVLFLYPVTPVCPVGLQCGHIHLSPLVSSMHEPSCPYTQLASGKPPSPSHVPCLCGGLVTIMPM